jgi:hypothetical protein
MLVKVTLSVSLPITISLPVPISTVIPAEPEIIEAVSNEDTLNCPSLAFRTNPSEELASSRFIEALNEALSILYLLVCKK